MSKCEFNSMVKVDPQLARIYFARWIVERTIESAEKELKKFQELQKAYQRYVENCAERSWYRLWNRVSPMSFDDFFLEVVRSNRWWSTVDIYFVWDRLVSFHDKTFNKILSAENCETFYVEAEHWGAVCSWAKDYSTSDLQSRAKAIEEVCDLIETAFNKLEISHEMSMKQFRREMNQVIEIVQSAF